MCHRKSKGPRIIVGRLNQRVFLSTFYHRVVRRSLFFESGVCLAIRALCLHFHNEIIVLGVLSGDGVKHLAKI